MIKSGFSKWARQFTRRGESGQAIIILALGFIALIAFVGIVTDVSLMFVRYSTLSRAVDAAAIAAAGQMRSDRNFGDVGIAARQFIEFHGLDPVRVLVETCQTTPQDPNDEDGDGITDDDPDTPDIKEGEPNPTLCPPDQRKLVRVTATITSPTIFMRLLGFANIELTAIALSETAVLDVVIVMDVSESMLFETTYQDWANIGMGKVYVPPRLGGRREPFYEDEDLNGVPNSADSVVWHPDEEGTVFKNEYMSQLNNDVIADPGYGNTPLWIAHPSDDPYLPALQKFWDDMIIISQQQDITDRLTYPDGSDADDGNNPADPDYAVQVYDYPGTTNNQSPRFECRVRFWPYSSAISLTPSVKAVYAAVGADWDRDKWDGFIPTYDFYGCCNDPTSGGKIDADTGALVPIDEGGSINYGFTSQYGGADYWFDDLICQPFKQARDATRQFLDRIDFSRGDRVAFVTFDRGSFLIDPDGAEGTDSQEYYDACGADFGEELVDHDDNDLTPDRTTFNHMIENSCRARQVLNKDLGVRAEPNFYVWKENGGGWEKYADGLDPLGRSKPLYYRYTSEYFNNTVVGFDSPDPTNPADQEQFGELNLNSYPTKDHCQFHNATLPQLSSRYSLWERGNYGTLSSLPGYDPTIYGAPGLYRSMIPPPWEGIWAGDGLDERNSYELWASCRGTNMGAAIRASSNALLDPNTTRRTGTVWVIVFLSDGAAGASDPVRQNGRRLREGAGLNGGEGPYADMGQANTFWEDWGGRTQVIRYGTVNAGLRSEYGAFGLCPLGTPGSADTRTRLTEPLPEGVQPTFPFCSDTEPGSRHFCLPPNTEPDELHLDEKRATVGGQCPDGASGTATGEFQAGFAPGSKDLGYECDPTLPDPNFPTDDVEAYNLRRGHIYDVDVGEWSKYGAVTTGACDPLYDVDDYARDWADYIALSRSDGNAAEQLPVIFTIGFGLNFPVGSTGDPSEPGYQPGPGSWNVPDYLGEELLRYIADVGDNNLIDNDLHQDWRDDGLNNDSLSEAEYGLRGPCEMQTMPPDPGGSPPYHVPLLPRVNCGNYYNAPDQAQLELVFDDIASRMFTRLSG